MGDILADMSCPNITGAFGTGGGSALLWPGDFGGAFYGTVGGTTALTENATINDRIYKAFIDASRTSSIYKDSRLQVPALQLLACIRC